MDDISPKTLSFYNIPSNFFPSQVKKEVGDVTILVNNAGVVYPADLLSTKDEEITKTFEVNILGHFWVSVRNISGLCMSDSSS